MKWMRYVGHMLKLSKKIVIIHLGEQDLMAKLTIPKSYT